MAEFRGAAKRRTRGGQGPATEPSHGVGRVQGRDQEEDKRRTRPSHTRPSPSGMTAAAGLSMCLTEPGHRAQPQSPATELTEFRGTAKRPRGGEEDKAQPQSPATESSDRVDRVQGRGQEEDKRRTRPTATEPSHRVDRVQGRGQEEDERRPRPSHRAQLESPATELTEFRGAAKRRTKGPATEPRHRAGAKRRTRGGQGPATEPS